MPKLQEMPDEHGWVGGDCGAPPPMPAIGGLQKMSLQDFPGKPSAIIFTRGCNLQCRYCHNADLIGPGPTQSPPEVWNYLVSRRSLLKGVVITGGEPTLHPQLRPFMHALQQLGYRVKLDTNGMQPHIVEELIADGVVDHLSVDWKIAPSHYGKMRASKPTPQVLESLQRCGAAARSAGITLEWRTTVVQPIVSLEDLWIIGSYLEPGDLWALQQYRPPVTNAPQESDANGDLRPFPMNDLEYIRGDFSELSVTIR